MIQNCQQFEQRIQELLDCRIDPETDEPLCSHSMVCSECYESLMAYSLMHTEFLKDSDSMKIKLESLGLHELTIRNREKRPGTRYMFPIAASIAAILLLLVALSTGSFNDRGTELVQESSVSLVIPPIDRSEAELVRARTESLENLRVSLGQFDEFYAYSAEFPGLRPLHALGACFDWLQKSWLEKIKSREERNPDFGRLNDRRFDLRYADLKFLAFNS